jgi:transcriptional regulator with XRE-family HTH domain
MNSRIRALRKTLKKSQEEFGKILGLSKSGISEIEAERRNVTEQHIIMLKTYKDPKYGNINETWLRTGEGEMFLPMDRETEIAKLTVDLLTEESDSFKNRLVSALSRLTEEQWELLAEIAEEITKKE